MSEQYKTLHTLFISFFHNKDSAVTGYVCPHWSNFRFSIPLQNIIESATLNTEIQNIMNTFYTLKPTVTILL